MNRSSLYLNTTRNRKMNSIKASDYSPTEQMTVHKKVKLCIAGTSGTYVDNDEGVLHFEGDNYMIENVDSSHNPAHLVFRQKLTRDMDINKVRHFSGVDFPQDILITSDCFDDNGYENSSYYHFLHSGTQFKICLECNYWFQEWSHNVDLLSFVEVFLTALSEYSDTTISKDILYDEGMLNIQFTQSFEESENIDLIINALEHRLRNEHFKALNWRNVEFPLVIKEDLKAPAKALINSISEIISEQDRVDNEIITNLVYQNNDWVVKFKFPLNKAYLLQEILQEQSSLLAKRSKEISDSDIIKGIKNINFLESGKSQLRLLNIISSHYGLDEASAIELYKDLSIQLQKVIFLIKEKILAN